MPVFNTKDWDLRDVWTLPSGELCVRPSCAELTSGTTAAVAAFSVRDPKTQEVWHYFVDSGNLLVKDENFTTVQSKPLGTSQTPRIVTWAVLDDELVIASPDFPTQWGLVGNGVIQAEKVDSVNPGRTAINVPKGICVSWAGRVVISDGEGVYFSDALAPRTFVAENIINPPGGVVYGMHVNAGGALILVTTDGVWALPEDAAAAGQIVLGVWSKLTDYQAFNYGLSTTSHGMVFGLTAGGFRRIDREGSDENTLSEQVMSRTTTPRIHFSDYRSVGRAYPGQAGPIITAPGTLMHMVDLDGKMRSWWTLPYAVVGVLQDQDGTEMYATAAKVLRPEGFEAANDSPFGVMAGRINMPPEASPVIREVEFMSDTEDTFYVTLKGTSKSGSSSPVVPLVGTSAWDTALTYVEMPLKSRRFLFSVRGDEIAFELKTVGYPARMPSTVAVSFRGPGRGRPNS